MFDKKRVIVLTMIILFSIFSFAQQHERVRKYEDIISFQLSEELGGAMVTSYHILDLIELYSEDKVITQIESSDLSFALGTLAYHYKYLRKISFHLDVEGVNNYPYQKAFEIGGYFSDLKEEVNITSDVQVHLDEVHYYASNWIMVLESVIPESRGSNISPELQDEYYSIANDFWKDILLKLSTIYPDVD